MPVISTMRHCYIVLDQFRLSENGLRLNLSHGDSLGIEEHTKDENLPSVVDDW